MSALIIFIQHSTGSPPEQLGRRKRKPNSKGESKIVSICRWHDLCRKLKTPKTNKNTKPNKLLVSVTSQDRKPMYESQLHFYKPSEKEIKKTTPFTIP